MVHILVFSCLADCSVTDFGLQSLEMPAAYSHIYATFLPAPQTIYHMPTYSTYLPTYTYTYIYSVPTYEYRTYTDNYTVPTYLYVCNCTRRVQWFLLFLISQGVHPLVKIDR